MTARAIGSGTLSFGLVNIPLKLYSASESSGRISFNQLHKKCKGRIKQQLFCPIDNEVVPREDIVKGYEFAKNEYVIFSDEELDALEEESTKVMDIREFVPLSTVDPLFFDSAYYLGPDKGADRPYHLLATALEETQEAAIALYSSRGRETPVLIRPLDGLLILQNLHFPTEVKDRSEIPVARSEVREEEVALARQFIQQLSKERFDPTKYKDARREKLMEVINKKIAGEAIAVAPPNAAPPATVVDLMAALKASLAKSKGSNDDTGTSAPAPASADAVDQTPRKGPKRAPAKGASSSAGANKKTAKRS